MAEGRISNVNYFLVGLGIGSAAAILFAPRSGEETRRIIARKSKEGNRYVQKKAREIQHRAEDVVDQGREMIMDAKDQIASAIDAGRETYHREKSRAHFG